MVVVLMYFNCFDKLFYVVFLVGCVVVYKFDFVNVFYVGSFVEFECVCMFFFKYSDIVVL